MLKRFVILGLALLLAGAAVLGWALGEKRKEQQQAARYRLKYASETKEYLKLYNEWSQLPPEERTQLPWGLNKYGENKSEAQLRQEQREKLEADIDKLAAGETDAHLFADFLYGENWQEELRKYKAAKEMKELILTGSIVCTSVGGIIFIGCLLLWTARLSIRGLPYLKKYFTGIFKSRKETGDKEPAKIDAKENEKNSERQQSQVEKHPKVLIISGWHNNFKGDPERKMMCPGSPETDFANRQELARPQTAPAVSNKANPDKAAKNTDPGGSSVQTSHLRQSVPKTAVSDSHEDSLKARTENLEKQVADFRRITQTAQQTTLEHSKPLEEGLEKLTQQVSAIREYAARQQNRMEKLQDGYDWNIIRNFCLRVIRCLDNLENRINRLSEEDIDTRELKEVRDELFFSLESSGVERFEPAINSDYRGQEKKIEALKDKQCCDHPDMKGKIAKVIRPGYQYVIDEENIKVVRTAQVKLYN